MRQNNLLAAYWLTEVGIGPAALSGPHILPGKQFVHVPITDVLNYRRTDGSLQIDIIYLTGCAFNEPETFQTEYLTFSDTLIKTLTDGSIAQLQKAGVKVCLSIVGNANTSVGWNSIPTELIDPFVNYLNTTILGAAAYGLDGIDIDNEYARAFPITHSLIPTVAQMRRTFASDKIISKALSNDEGFIGELKDKLTLGNIMSYGNSAAQLEAIYANYRQLGLRSDQLTIGVNAGPVEQGGSFTSLATTKAITTWEPAGERKRGVMIWTFSQDIQQFTAYPQNQKSLAFPNKDDHAWQRAIIETMESAD